VSLNILRCGGVAWGVVGLFTNIIVFKMNLFLETLSFFVLFVYYILESIVLFFIPSRCRRKDVKCQTVLITGAGTFSIYGETVAKHSAANDTHTVPHNVNTFSVFGCTFDTNVLLSGVAAKNGQQRFVVFCCYLTIILKILCFVTIHWSQSRSGLNCMVLI